MGMFGMGTAGMGMLRKAGLGAAAGGIMGGMSDNGSALGGAIGGAAAGLAMTKGNMSRLGGLGGGASSIAQKGLGYGATGAGMLRGGLPKLLSNSGYGNAAVGFGMAGAGAASRGMSRAASYIGNKSININRYGARALAGLGAGSAAMIGSSIMSSNRGY